jgi:hypothetical protein
VRFEVLTAVSPPRRVQEHKAILFYTEKNIMSNICMSTEKGKEGQNSDV